MFAKQKYKVNETWGIPWVVQRISPIISECSTLESQSFKPQIAMLKVLPYFMKAKNLPVKPDHWKNLQFLRSECGKSCDLF